jgi:hypothetical protein
MLKIFLNLLPVYKQYPLDQPVEYQITDDYSVPGVGTVGMYIKSVYFLFKIAHLLCDNIVSGSRSFVKINFRIINITL